MRMPDLPRIARDCDRRVLWRLMGAFSRDDCGRTNTRIIYGCVRGNAES